MDLGVNKDIENIGTVKPKRHAERSIHLGEVRCSERRQKRECRQRKRRVKQISIDFPDRRSKAERRAFDRRSSLFVKLFYRLTKPIVRAVLYLFWIAEVKGIENVSGSDSAIIVANHSSYLDFFIISAVIRRRLYFLAAQELHRVPVLRWFMKYNERIYLDRERPGVRYFREVVRILQQKKLVVLFPEGTRSENGKIQRGKLGFVKLGIVARVPIVPVGISGMFNLLPKSAAFPRFSRSCKVRIGEPIFLDKYFGKKVGKGSLQQIADDIMSKISKLSEIPIGFHCK
jgi:1-acyl-sn-glycerol-3-phosphate acyltransferase